MKPGNPLTLLDNGADPLTVSGSQTFTFSKPVPMGSDYYVTIGTQPPGQNCFIAYSDFIANANVTNIVVSCSDVPDWLYFFGTNYSGADASVPTGPLLQASDGNFYGLSNGGGTTNLGVHGGTVFKYVPSVGESLLWSFGSPGDGANPAGALIQGSDGNLYGTTIAGGTYGYGTVFRLTLAGQETVLYSFPDPNSLLYFKSIVFGSDGNLYGTASGGNPDNGFIFQITAQGAFSVIHSFVGSDGSCPNFIMQASDGNFYGTTYSGGSHWNGVYCDSNTTSGGVLFRMTPSGNVTVMHSFGASGDGSTPQFVTVGNDGNFYGTTAFGGANFGSWGTLFKVTPGGTETVLHSFGGAEGLDAPNPTLAQGSDGYFYGSARIGGQLSAGVLYKFSPTGAETNLVIFGSAEVVGANPNGIIFGRDGNIYGTTQAGHINNNYDGTIFRLSP